MKFFLCVLDPANETVPEDVRRPYESMPRARGLPFRWRSFKHAALLEGGAGGGIVPGSVVEGGWLAVGVVRLDNRSDLERDAGRHGGDDVTDLALVLRAVARHGSEYVSTILGDFAFVLWHADSRAVIAACDAMAARKLYYATRQGALAFASRAECLAISGRYEKQYFAERIAESLPSPGLTPFADVRLLPAATVAKLEGGRLTLRPYWSPWAFEPPARSAMPSTPVIVETCRGLLAESVRLRLGGAAETWAHLSGGLDSSSVVSIAQWLLERGKVAHGIAGTITYVDRAATAADEREYSDAVVRRWGIRNVPIIDAPMWHDDQYEPPYLDQPRPDFMFFPRDRRVCAIIEKAGGRILLTGIGSDEALTGNMLFFSDLIARGHIGAAIGQMATWAAIGHVSFWELAYRNGLLPLLWAKLRAQAARKETPLPPWLTAATVRQYDLRGRHFDTQMYAGRLGHKYYDLVAAGLVAISRMLEPGLLSDEFDFRCPFLYRPFLEFALGLFPDFCAQPCARKWILRQAVRDIVPEVVRTRVGKGSAGEPFAWSLVQQRPLLVPLVRRPMLADLGLIDAKILSGALDAAASLSQDKSQQYAVLQHTLAIEAWLQMRAGQWPPETNREPRVQKQASHAVAAASN